MEEIYSEPKYTMRWLGLQSLFVLVISIVLALIDSGLNGFALNRQETGLLSNLSYNYLSQSITYCFAVLTITLASIMLIEIAFRKVINYLQYGLIGSAIALFNLILLAFAEKMPFWCAYVLVSVMIIGLISCYIFGLTRNAKALCVVASLLSLEYGLIFILAYIGSMSLLIGSITLFVLLAVAMYLTLKLKVENEELIFK